MPRYVGYNDVEGLVNFRTTVINLYPSENKDVIKFATEYATKMFGGTTEDLLNYAIHAYSAKEYQKFGGTNISKMLEHKKVYHSFKNSSLLGVINFLYYVGTQDIFFSIDEESKKLIAKRFSQKALDISLDSIYTDDSDFSVLSDIVQYATNTGDSFTNVFENYKADDYVDNKTPKIHDDIKSEVNNYTEKTSESIEPNPEILKADFYVELLRLQQDLFYFGGYSKIPEEVSFMENKYKSLDERCRQTVDLKYEIEENAKFLAEQTSDLTFTESNSVPYRNLCKAYKAFSDKYNGLSKNEFVKTSYELEGVFSKKMKTITSTNEAYITNNFFNKPSSAPIPEPSTFESTNAITYFLNHSDFLYMKELDYKNLEAYVRRSAFKGISKTDTRKTMLIIYLLLYLNYKTDLTNTGHLKTINELFTKIKNAKWEHHYSEFEKVFSLGFNFTKYEKNPFTYFMNDKEFNKSQNDAKKIREELELQAKDVLNKLKEIVYVSYDGKASYGIYSIFQGIADIAYELATPLELDLDMSIDNVENIISSFLNACVTSIEMQTSIMIFDFLFNFGFWIGGEYYTLNKINNILNTLNIVIDISKDSAKFESTMNNKRILARNTTYYSNYEKLGFLAYDKKFDVITDNESKDKNLTGYYLSDEPLGFDEVEYMRRYAKQEISPGDLDQISVAINLLRTNELYAMFIFNKKKNYLTGFDKINYQSGKGYLVIKSYVDSIDSGNPELFKYIDKIRLNPREFNSYINNLKRVISNYIYNAKVNRDMLIDNIAMSADDSKILDWAMKMIPTYELIADAFGFKGLEHIKTLDTFIKSLLDLLNVVMNLSFDKLKTDTRISVNMRSIRLIEKENYYYLQAFPVLIDWIMLEIEATLQEFLVTTDIETDVDEDSIEYNRYQQEKLEFFEKKLIAKLKYELQHLSATQLSLVENNLKLKLLDIDGISEEKAIELSKAIINVDSLSYRIFKGMPSKVSDSVAKEIQETIDITI